MSATVRVLMFLARKQRPPNIILSQATSKIKSFVSCKYIKKQLATSHPHLQYFTPISLSSISLMADIAEGVVLA